MCNAVYHICFIHPLIHFSLTACALHNSIQMGANVKNVWMIIIWKKKYLDMYTIVLPLQQHVHIVKRPRQRYPEWHTGCLAPHVDKMTPCHSFTTYTYSYSYYNLCLIYSTQTWERYWSHQPFQKVMDFLHCWTTSQLLSQSFYDVFFLLCFFPHPQSTCI